MVRVLHAKQPAFTAPVTFDPEEFTSVAEVDTDDLETAFALTNHIDRPWTSNPGVRPLVSFACRSTSVGDVLERDGRIYAVAGTGFIPIKAG